MNPPTEAQTQRLHTVAAAEVAPTKVSWLWPGRIPLGKLTLLDGDPDVGKSTLTLDLAARVSNGTEWPDDTPAKQGAVIVLSAEDGFADTIRPRLDAAGANLTEVHLVRETLDAAGKGRVPVLPDDATALGIRIAETGAVLVIVDVLDAFLSSEVDTFRNQDVRRALHVLAKLAEATNCAILCIRHFTKRSGRAIHRGGGSIGIIGAARSGLVAGTDPDDETRRVLAVAKGNLAKPADRVSLAYQIVPSRADPDVPCIKWLGPVDVTADRLTSTPETGDDRADIEVAREVILAGLKDKDASWEDLTAEIASQGVSERTGRRARDKLKDEGLIATFKQGAGPWLWNLTTADGQVPDGQVPKQPLTSGNAENESEVVHRRGHGQVLPFQAAEEHLRKAGMLDPTPEEGVARG